MKRKLKVCLDPGHGGTDRSNQGPTGYNEADGNLKIAIMAAQYLERYPDIEIVWTRLYANDTVSLAERCRIANEADADAFVSIHSNAAADPAVRGTETYHSVKSLSGRGGALLAALAHANVINLLQTENRGLRTRANDKGGDYYAVIRDTLMPAIICEVAFHTNPDDEANLKQEHFRRRAAMGIAKGIVEYFGLEWIPPGCLAAQGKLRQIEEILEQ